MVVLQTTSLKFIARYANIQIPPIADVASIVDSVLAYIQGAAIAMS